MFEEWQDRLKTALGELYLEFPSANDQRVALLKASAPSSEEYQRWIGQMSNPRTRYEIEFSGNYYHSYKPGIDDVDLPSRHYFRTVVEIGGGPAYIARTAPAGLRFCVDIAAHPEQKEYDVTFIPGDICAADIVQRVGAIVTPSWQAIQTPCQDGGLVVLSYCLDRVSDQVKALRHFVQIMDLFEGGRGLITVCLPATPMSPGNGIRYDDGTWLTTGADPIQQFEQIRQAVVRAKAGSMIKFMGGGLTVHYGVSLADGYEELPCYVLWFSNGSERIQYAPDISHGWMGEHGALTRRAPEPWKR